MMNQTIKNNCVVGVLSLTIVVVVLFSSSIDVVDAALVNRHHFVVTRHPPPIPILDIGTRHHKNKKNNDRADSTVATSAVTFIKAAKAKMSSAKDDEFDSSIGDNLVCDSSKSRREVLSSFMMAAVAIATATSMHVPPAYAKGMKPDDALRNLILAREEMVHGARTYLPKGDYVGLKVYLDEVATHMNKYEIYSSALLESKALDAESKKAIGTIRTYGVGADVLIMYGGLKNELNESPPDSSSVIKYIQRTINSLDEVIAICRSNDGFDGI